MIEVVLIIQMTIFLGVLLSLEIRAMRQERITREVVNLMHQSVATFSKVLATFSEVNRDMSVFCKHVTDLYAAEKAKYIN